MFLRMDQMLFVCMCVCVCVVFINVCSYCVVKQTNKQTKTSWIWMATKM